MSYQPWVDHLLDIDRPLIRSVMNGGIWLYDVTMFNLFLSLLCPDVYRMCVYNC